jgi:hypothetical protein
LLALEVADAFAAVVVVAAGVTVNVCVVSVLVRKLAPGLYTAVIAYEPAAVLAGNTKVALAVPDVMAPEVTGVPMVVPPCDTENVTVPAFTVPATLVTVAESATFWLLSLKLVVALPAAVVVGAGVTDNVCVLSLLLPNPPAPLYAAVIV